MPMTAFSQGAADVNGRFMPAGQASVPVTD
jgi:hypothetical protein